MVVFGKPNSAIGEQLNAVHEEQLHYEGELAFVVEQGRYTAVGFGLDLTKRQLQSELKSKGLPWERAKAFDGAALFSRFVAFDRIEDLSLSLDIDGETVQAGGVDLMMYKPSTIIAELARFVTLEDGDVIMTGTPEGVGVVEKGSVFRGAVIENGNKIVEASWTAK